MTTHELASFAAAYALQNLAGSPADEFLMQLGKLAGDYHQPVSAQDDNHVFHRFRDPVRRFIDDHGVLQIPHLFQRGAPLA